MSDQLVTYFSDNGSSDDESFDAVAAEAAGLEEAIESLSEADEEFSDTEDDIVDLSLPKSMLPNKSIGFINPKTGWGDKAKIVATRKGKIDLNYFPDAGKALVVPRDDLQPTSSGLKPRLNEMWVVATRGTTQMDRALLVAFGSPESVSKSPKNAEWGFSLLPPQQDERIVHEIITAKNIPLTTELKHELLAASNSAGRSLANLPAAVQDALKEYGGLAYGSSTVAFLERQAKTLATKPKPAAAKKRKAASNLVLPVPVKTKPKVDTPPQQRTASALTQDPEPKSAAVATTTELTFTLTVTGPRSKIAKLMDQTA
jgi:hypothetical protein